MRLKLEMRGFGVIFETREEQLWSIYKYNAHRDGVYSKEKKERVMLILLINPGLSRPPFPQEKVRNGGIRRRGKKQNQLIYMASYFGKGKFRKIGREER